jgi:hypothetical protein
VFVVAGASYINRDNLTPVHSRRTPAPSDSSGGAAFCAGRA